MGRNDQPAEQPTAVDVASDEDGQPSSHADATAIRQAAQIRDELGTRTIDGEIVASVDSLIVLLDRHAVVSVERSEEILAGLDLADRETALERLLAAYFNSGWVSDDRIRRLYDQAPHADTEPAPANAPAGIDEDAKKPSAVVIFAMFVVAFFAGLAVARQISDGFLYTDSIVPTEADAAND